MENFGECQIKTTKTKEEKNGLIKKYPFNGRSKYLIDKFYIIGYEPNQFKKLITNNNQNRKNLENLAKKIKNEAYGKKCTKQRFTVQELPTLLNEISNDYKKKLPDIDLINDMIFPNKADILVKGYYTKKQFQSSVNTQDNFLIRRNKSSQSGQTEDFDNTPIRRENTGRDTILSISSSRSNDEEDNMRIKKSQQYIVVFSYNPQEGKNSKKSINGFAFIFYKRYKETISIKDVNFVFYIPMTFCIISEYPYYNSYYKLCKQIIHLFQSPKNEIPIEIILYNIINFTMSPINGDISLNIEPVNYPSEKTLVETFSTISKKKTEKEDKNENDNDDKSDELGLMYYDNEIYDYDNNEENNDEEFILELKNEKKNINDSPIFKTIYNSARNTKDKRSSEKNLKIDKKIDLDLEKKGCMSPNLSDTKIKRKLSNTELENDDRPKLNDLAVLNVDRNSSSINNNKKNKSKFEEIKFQSLSGYPLIQYNLPRVLLHKLSPQDVIIIFLYSFLEKSILFFSHNLEYLSLTINSYLNLNYPLNDEKYYFFNACVSYENFINDNSPFVGTTFTNILGINSSYNPDYIKNANIKLKDHLAVDLDNGVIIQVEDPNNKDKNLKNKLFFEYIKKIYKKESKEDKGIILGREVRILYEKLDYYKNYINDNGNYGRYSTTSNHKTNNNNIFIDYNEDGPNSIKINNRKIQEGFYRLVNNICLYFYQKLSLISDDDKKNLNKVVINSKQKGTLSAETMNVIFHKDADNNYTKEEKYLLDELIETMKFDSFVYGFIQSYDPIDLYKIPLTLTEEFISILSRKNFLKNQNINFFSLIDNLYKKNGNEKIFIDFNPFSSEYFKRMKNYFDREIFENNNYKNSKGNFKDKYINVIITKKDEGQIIDGLYYNEFILDNDLIIKYMRYLKNLNKEQYYHMFHLAGLLEQNKIKTIPVIEIENEIEIYSNNLEIISKKDICNSNIIILFILSLKSIQKYIDYQLVLSTLLKKFNVFRKYYTMIMNLLYRLINECIDKKDYINAQNYFFCYYSCINSLLSLKLVPNENLMKIILKFNQIDLNDLLEKANNCDEKSKDNQKDKDNNIIENDNILGDEKIKESYQNQYICVTYNFNKNSFIKENVIIQKTNELKGKKTLKIKTPKEAKSFIEPKIKFNNGEFEYECLISTQDKIQDDLHRQYEIFLKDLNEDNLNIKILFESCLNIILFLRNTCLDEMYDIFDIFKVIFNVYLQKICSKKNGDISVGVLN